MCTRWDLITFPLHGVKLSVYPWAEANAWPLSAGARCRRRPRWLPARTERSLLTLVATKEHFSPFSQLWIRTMKNKYGPTFIIQPSCVGLVMSPSPRRDLSAVRHDIAAFVTNSDNGSAVLPVLLPAAARDLVPRRCPVELAVIKLHISIDLLYLFLRSGCRLPACFPPFPIPS